MADRKTDKTKRQVDLDNPRLGIDSSGIKYRGIPIPTLEELGIPNVLNTKHNLDATVDPTANDDETKGYSPGSMWINTTTNVAFFCVEASAGLAMWKSYAVLDLSNVNDTDILNKIKNVDGSGSGLDADLLHGMAPGSTLNKIMYIQSSNGYPSTLTPSIEGLFSALGI